MNGSSSLLKSSEVARDLPANLQPCDQPCEHRDGSDRFSFPLGNRSYQSLPRGNDSTTCLASDLSSGSPKNSLKAPHGYSSVKRGKGGVRAQGQTRAKEIDRSVARGKEKADVGSGAFGVLGLLDQPIDVGFGSSPIDGSGPVGSIVASGKVCGLSLNGEDLGAAGSEASNSTSTAIALMEVAALPSSSGPDTNIASTPNDQQSKPLYVNTNAQAKLEGKSKKKSAMKKPYSPTKQDKNSSPTLPIVDVAINNIGIDTSADTYLVAAASAELARLPTSVGIDAGHSAQGLQFQLGSVSSNPSTSLVVTVPLKLPSASTDSLNEAQALALFQETLTNDQPKISLACLQYTDYDGLDNAILGDDSLSSVPKSRGVSYIGGKLRKIRKKNVKIDVPQSKCHDDLL